MSGVFLWCGEILWNIPFPLGVRFALFYPSDTLLLISTALLVLFIGTLRLMGMGYITVSVFTTIYCLHELDAPQ